MARSGARNRARVGIAVLAVLAVVVAVLAVWALQRGETAPDASPRTAPPSATPQTPSASPTSTPDPTASSAPVAIAREDERFLAVGAEGTVWRGLAGSCESGKEPLIERSGDGGQNWTDVTPSYRNVTQLLRLDPLAGAQGEMIATVIDERDTENVCLTQALRTFSYGEFWEPYPDVLAEATYPAPDLSAVVTPGVEQEMPCAEPRSIRSTGALIALVCDGQAMTLSEDDWDAIGPSGAVALTVFDSALVVAHASDDCEGLAFSTMGTDGEGASTCDAELDASAPTAIDVRDGLATVWNGDDVSTTELPTA